jgi:CRISPR/Cas system endoribonuclease Cas6 (RAMP superfamily)
MKKRRYKTKLEKLAEETVFDAPYYPTQEDCIKWFRILNRELFDSTLSEVDSIDIRRRRKTWAFYYCSWCMITDKILETKLCMNRKYPNKKFFVEVLAHEMIHHYQFLNCEPLGHGPTFFKWKSKFKRNGLTLKEKGE